MSLGSIGDFFDRTVNIGLEVIGYGILVAALCGLGYLGASGAIAEARHFGFPLPLLLCGMAALAVSLYLARKAILGGLKYGLLGITLVIFCIGILGFFVSALWALNDLLGQIGIFLTAPIGFKAGAGGSWIPTVGLLVFGPIAGFAWFCWKQSATTQPTIGETPSDPLASALSGGPK